jgi:Fur family ferric uptake transcriptional regulator
MTLAPERTPAAIRDADDAFRLLRASGHRVSLPARLVLEALFDADRPVSADELAALADMELDASSVYRNLERLQQLGVVSHVHPGHGPGLYAVARGRDQEYLVCDRCHRLTPLDPGRLDPIRDSLRASFGHHAHFTHFPIHGVCARCATLESGGDP